MNTPDLTLEDGAGAAAAIAGLAFALQSEDSTVQLAGVIGLIVIGSLIVLAGAYRRGKRADNIQNV